MVAAAGVAVCLAQAALAQYSKDPNVNLAIADLGGDQVQAKVAPTSDGGAYISWFDSRTAGYSVYLQRVNACGVEQWAHNGVLVATRTLSSTQDYSLITDSDGNAVVAFNDFSGASGTSSPGNITIKRVSPAGATVWSSTVTSGTDFKGPPSIAELSDGNFAVAWTQSVVVNSVTQQAVQAQRVDRATGSTLLASPVVIFEAGKYVSLSDVKASDNGGFIVLWVRGSTASAITSSKALYTQRFDSTGTATWNSGNPLIVFNTTSIQNGYFPPMVSDGAGGAVYGWYETGGSRNAYIQHVLANGTLKFASPVANTGVTSGRIRISAGLAYDPARQEYFLASVDSSSPTQGNYLTFVQKFDSTGARLWTDTGAVIVPQAATGQQGFVQAVPTGDGGVQVFGFNLQAATTHVLFGGTVASDGTVTWTGLPSANVISKSRLAVGKSTAGYAILAWGDGASGGASDIKIQNVFKSGWLGPCPADFDCSGSTEVADIFAFLGAWFGNSLTSDIDGNTQIEVADIFAFLSYWFGGC